MQFLPKDYGEKRGKGLKKREETKRDNKCKRPNEYDSLSLRLSPESWLPHHWNLPKE